jgi:hypothetical protein
MAIPNYYDSLFSPEQMSDIRYQGVSQGLLGLGQALSRAGAPSLMPQGSGLSEGLAAFSQGYQGNMDRALQDMLRGSQVKQMLDKQRQEKEFRDRLAQAYSTRPVGTGLTMTGEGSQQQMLLDQIQDFGQEGARSTIGALQSNVNLPTEQTIDFNKLVQAIAITDPVEAAKLMQPKETKMTGSVGEFAEAKRLGFIPETMSFETFKNIGKGPLVQNILGGSKLTPGQESIDKKFADDYVAWRSGGGQDMTSQIAQLKPVIEALESGQPITGIQVAVQPDLLLAITNPKALQSREQVEEVVQRNLRAVLGAQFTEKEGERLISRAYNPKLAPEENAKRVRKLFLQMSTAAEQKQAMVDYFDQNGTLRGFTGKMPSVQDFYKAIEGETPTLTIQEEAKAILEKREKR